MSGRESIRYKRLRKMLLDLKKKMWADLRDELFRKLGNEYNAQFDNPHDIEELGLIDVIEDTGLAVADIRRRDLEQMDAALTKLDDGTYGVCEACEEEIDEERLKVVPYTSHCVRCQKDLEGPIKTPTT
ncbi:MAG TPA: TraR/DksA C4-type zinc finger protein [Thermodesulfobacteriota bacterium]|nr:TraR/DksA C4-type zinc finger protein [Thermodesulfobacteriota bacterium]